MAGFKALILFFAVLAVFAVSQSCDDLESQCDDYVDIPQPTQNATDLEKTEQPGDDNEEELLQANGTKPAERLIFDDPDAAYNILEQLDIFESIDPPNANSSRYKKSFWGLKVNDNYCKEHRRYFVNKPEKLMKRKNFITDYWWNRLRRVTIPSIGRNIGGRIGFDYRNIPENSVNMSVKASIFYFNTRMHPYRKIGQQFSCLTQISNHVLNNDFVIKKDNFTMALREYQKSYETRPQCLTKEQYFPNAWVLYNEDQCNLFFEEFNSQKYVDLKNERRVVYIRKIGAGVHEAAGVFVVDEKEEAYLRELYANGSMCGKIRDNNVVQYMIPNPLLLENRKFDFRIFLYIASANPVIAYYYDGNLKVSLHEYDTKSEELGVFVTNIALSKNLFETAEKNGTYNGYTSEQLRSKTHWNYDDFFNYLWRTGQITDPNWIENVLRKNMKKLLVHVTRIVRGPFAKKSSMMELYGVDLIMDDKYELWYIESNQKPLIEGWTPEIVPYFDKLLLDSFEVSFGLLKSRTKRIIKYVNEIIRDPTSWRVVDGGLVLDNLAERREEFRQLSTNYFEPEFVPSAANGFQLIVDENKPLKERYYGLEDECL